MQNANEQAQAKKQKTLQKSGLASQTIEIATKSQRKRKLSQKNARQCYPIDQHVAHRFKHPCPVSLMD